MSKENNNNQSASFCSFRVGGRLFGADILDVKEINTVLDFTPVHHSPDEVEGYVNIRGQIHLILSLRKMLGITEETDGLQQRLVLFKDSVGADFGIVVDSIGDIVKVMPDQIEDKRKHSSSAMNIMECSAHNIDLGVCKLQDELMIILSTKKLLECVEKVAQET